MQYVLTETYSLSILSGRTQSIFQIKYLHFVLHSQLPFMMVVHMQVTTIKLTGALTGYRGCQLFSTATMWQCLEWFAVFCTKCENHSHLLDKLLMMFVTVWLCNGFSMYDVCITQKPLRLTASGEDGPRNTWEIDTWLFRSSFIYDFVPGRPKG